VVEATSTVSGAWLRVTTPASFDEAWGRLTALFLRYPPDASAVFDRHRWRLRNVYTGRVELALRSAA